MKVTVRPVLPSGATGIFHSWRTFRPALRGEGGRIAGALGLALIITVLELARPWPIKWVVDYIVVDQTVDTDLSQGIWSIVGPVLPYIAVALVVPIGLGITTMALTVEVAKIGRKASVRIRRQLFDHIQRLELSEHHTRYSGDLLVRLMGDVNMVRDLLFASWITIISRGTVLVATAVIFSLVEWRLLMMALLPLPWLWFGVSSTARKVKTAAGKQRKKEGRIAAYAAEMLAQVGMIKAFSGEEAASERFRSDARSAERATLAATRHSASMARLTEIIIGLGVAIVLLFGTMYALVGIITPGELLVVLSYTRLIYKPIRKLTAEGARLAKASACAARVTDILDLPTEHTAAGSPVPTLRGDIALRNVRHSYPDGRASLRGVTVDIPAGSLVAVTGENGSGKSTTLGLLLRLYRPTSGTVLVDEQDIADFDLEGYRRQIAYVPQEIALLGTTIRENIAYGRPDATDADLEQAAAVALLTPVINGLPEGWDTELDEGGSSLSGGQARRLMIARAAVRDAPIVLLDEPLAGLDPDAAAIVARAIAGLAQGRTTIVIHHGELTDLRPDIVLEMAAGELIDTSTPDDIIEPKVVTG